IDPVRASVVLDAAFNLGISGLIKDFPKFVDAVAREDWISASAELRVKDPKLDSSRYAPLRQLILKGSVRSLIGVPSMQGYRTILVAFISAFLMPLLVAQLAKWGLHLSADQQATLQGWLISGGMGIAMVVMRLLTSTPVGKKPAQPPSS